ncbi:hypothetical protein DL93DRAFT_2162650 [Clavulina sp. PMI_390]|nr:hypothetical protein DL93DRAFT_2162650 [Clavulina sp. PMI_390]
MHLLVLSAPGAVAVATYAGTPNLLRRRQMGSNEGFSTAIGIDATIYQLPYEILVQIFKLAQLSLSYGSEPFSLAPFLLAITAVSSRWREVAISASQLWDTIHVPLYDQHNIEGVIGYVQNLMTRSHKRLLDVRISTDIHSPKDGSRRLFSLLLDHSSRIEALTLRLRYHEALLLPLTGSFGHLKDLDIHFRAGSLGTGNIPSIISPNAAPNIRKFTYLGNSPLFTNIETSNMEEVFIQGLNVRPTLDFLPRCRSLRRATLRPWLGEDPFGMAVNLPELEFLEVVDIIFLHLLRYIVAPSLKELHIVRGSRMSVIPLDESVPLVPPKGLVKLTLTYFNLAKETNHGGIKCDMAGPLSKLLLAYSSVESLTLIGCSQLSAFIALLVEGPPPEPSETTNSNMEFPRIRGYGLSTLQSHDAPGLGLLAASKAPRLLPNLREFSILPPPDIAQVGQHTIGDWDVWNAASEELMLSRPELHWHVDDNLLRAVGAEGF